MTQITKRVEELEKGDIIVLNKGVRMTVTGEIEVGKHGVKVPNDRHPHTRAPIGTQIPVLMSDDIPDEEE